MSARIQKFFAAKAVGTVQGRNLIKGLLGEHGEKLVSIMHDCSLQLSDKEKAALLEESLFKVTTKVVILLHTNKIKFSEFTPLFLPTRSFLLSLIDACEMTSFGYEAKTLTTYMDLISEGIQKILRPHVTGKSIERTKLLQSFWSNKDTLDKFMQQDKLKFEFADELTKILDELEVRKDQGTEKEEKKEK